MPESKAARVRRLVAAGSSPEQAAQAVGWAPSQVRAALQRRGPGRPEVDTEHLRVRIDGPLYRRAVAAGVDLRAVVERALARAVR